MNYTLHEAIAEVLKTFPDRSATYLEISKLLKEKKLYIRKDGNPPPASQISARANNYSNLFVKTEKGKIKLIRG